jgi:hypothetical protein
MVTAAKGMSHAEAWDAGFDDEVHDLWVETVHPAVQAIEEAVRENKSLLSFAADTSGAAKAAFPGLVLIGAGMVNTRQCLQLPDDQLVAVAGGDPSGPSTAGVF